MQKVTYIEFLSAISIDSAGANTFKEMAKDGFDSILKICSMSVDQIEDVGRKRKRTIGHSRAVKIWNSLHSERIQKLINFSDNFIEDVKQKILKTKIDIRDKKICFTGKGPFSRKELTTRLEDAGAIVVTSVANTTDYLLVGDLNTTSSKSKKAKANGHTIVCLYEDIF